MPQIHTSYTRNKKIFTLYSPKAKLAQKITVVQNKKNFTALIKDRLLAFEPPSTVQNPKFGAGLFSRCEEGLNLGLSSFCGFGEVCMSRVCVWVGGEFVFICFEYVFMCGGGHIMNMLS